jgi:hypothetical protein
MAKRICIALFLLILAGPACRQKTGVIGDLLPLLRIQSGIQKSVDLRDLFVSGDYRLEDQPRGRT